MSEIRDRLERLAARGTRRGADDVLHDAMLVPGAATLGVLAFWQPEKQHAGHAEISELAALLDELVHREVELFRK